MLYNIVTVFLMTTALMPPAILQYYAFEPLLKHRQKVLVLGGYAVLYLMELIFFLYMFVWGPWEHSFILYKKSLSSPGFPISLGRRDDPALCIPPSLRLFHPRSLYDLRPHPDGPDPAGHLPWRQLPAALSAAIYPAQWLFYIVCYMALMPMLRRYFNEVFVKYRHLTTHHYWKYISMLPLFLLLDMYFIMASSDVLIMDRMILPRSILLLALLIIAQSIRTGLR